MADHVSPSVAPPRLPSWLRRPVRTDADYGRVSRLLSELSLSTVCRSAQCPNRHECWNHGTATFLILGNRCTRNCRFCAVEHGPAGAPEPDEPTRVATAARAMKLRHVVVTSVTRDDLPDGGAGHFAATIAVLRGALADVTIEVLTPDFQGRPTDVDTVLAAAPDVFNHNLETVRRLQAHVRPQASYATSLAVLRRAAARAGGPAVKSGLMLGLGETDEEIAAALADLRAAGVVWLTLGQYLAPTRAHWPVARFVPPEEFADWRRRALVLGFTAVASGPLVRSSYQAERLLDKNAAAATLAAAE